MWSPEARALWEEYKMWRDMGTIGRPVELREALALEAVHAIVKPLFGSLFEETLDRALDPPGEEE
jgi:hypothetical protein